MSRCMSEGRSLYRINDKNPSDGCYPLRQFIEADHWNYQMWGVFWTVNRFNGPRRKENCTEIIAWAVDLDDGSKAEQIERIKAGPLIPSYVTETARGHHVYFDAKDGTPETYTDIVERLVEFYHGDKNAKDVCRILRVPSYLHWKGAEPFGIKCVFQSDSIYTEAEMRSAFPAKVTAEEQKTELKRTLRSVGADGLWERIWNLDCEDALHRLSGHSAVNSESFTFRKNANGNLNILVNGKGTSCWVDRDRRIGSHDKGGPTVFQWINWYTKDSKATLRVIKDLFPEVAK